VYLSSYYSFALRFLITCKIDQNTGEKCHFIHKSVEKCDMQMQNSILISGVGGGDWRLVVVLGDGGSDRRSVDGGRWRWSGIRRVMVVATDG